MNAFEVLKFFLRIKVPLFQLGLGTFVSLSFLTIVIPLATKAQVPKPITESGLGTKVSDPIGLGGGVTQYNITKGTPIGSNLFHSFADFNVPGSTIANFQNDSGLNTSNILSRVTGGNPSSIFGTVQTEGFGNANLFLMNPAGIVFGPNATLNVGGDAHFTTADYLTFSDRVEFSALPSAQDAVLSSAAVASFGFLSPTPAGISVQGSRLSVQEGQSISFVAGGVTMTGGEIKASGGKINIVSVASEGHVNFNNSGENPSFEADSFKSLGVVEISAGATLDAGGTSGGSIVIRGGVLAVDNTNADASGVGHGETGGSILLLAEEEVSLTGNTAITASGDVAGGTILVGGNIQGQGPESNAKKTFIGPDTTITADAIRKGPGGKVVVWADQSTGFYGNIFARGGIDGGNGGFVETSGKQVLNAWGFVDVSASNGFGGTWLLDPANVTIQNGAGTIPNINDTFTGTAPPSTVSDTSIETALNAGNDVNVIITTNADLGLNNQDGNIIQNADAGIEKTAGTTATLTLNAANNIELNGGISSTTGILNVALNANDAAQAGHDLNPNSGDVAINSAIDTHGGSFTSTGVNFTAMANSSISTNGSDSGNVNITATDTVSLDSASIVTSASGFDVPGTVMITSHDMVMNNSTISADTVNADAPPTAINIDISGKLTISTVDAQALNARTTGAGDAGEIHISSNEMDVTAEGFNEFEFSVIDTHTSGTGDAGDVDVIVRTGDFTVLGDPFFALVSVINTGTDGVNVGIGGDIDIRGNNILFENTNLNTGNNLIFFGGSSTSGNVKIVSERLDLNLSQILTDNVLSGGTTGTGGDIQITTDELNMSFSSLSSSGREGSGGITIMSDRLFASDSNIIAQTRVGPGKPINILGETLEFTNKSTVISTTGGNGDAASISITATDRILLAASGDPSGFFSNSRGIFGTQGNSGDITVTTPILEMTGGARINSITASSGKGGNVTINAAQSISMSGETSGQDPEPLFSLGAIQPSGIFTKTIGDTGCTGLCGNAGNVTISTGTLTLGDGAQINSGTESSGKAGDITVTATDTIAISGTLSDGSPAGLLSRSAGTDPDSGAGGNISLTAGESFSLTNGSAISASSTSAGSSGNITVETTNGMVHVSNANISTSATEAESGGIIIRSGQDVDLQNGTTISAETFGAGKSGNIEIGSVGNVLNDNSIISTSAAKARGGDINITAGQNAEFTNNSLVTALNTNTNAQAIAADPNGLVGKAGRIEVVAGNTILVDNSTFNVQSVAGNAGDIKFDADFMIHVIDSVISGSTGGGSFTKGADIDFDPQWIIIENSQILANAFEGQGGSITLTADNGVFIDTSTIIDFSSTFGTSGSLDVQAPIINLSGVITPLPQGTLKVAKMYAERCAAQKGGQFSSFVQGGRDGLPPSPGGFMSSPLHMSAPPSFSGSLPTISGSSGNMVKRLGMDPDAELVGHSGKAHWMIGDSIQGCAA